MKKYLLIFVIVYSTSITFAQNWQIINPGISTYYIDTANYISNLNISDTIISGDTTYFLNYKNYRSHTSSTLTESSFIGDSIGVLADGLNFIKSNGHTFYINTIATINDHWEFYHYPNGNYLEAEIISLDTLTILTQLDSVKFIQIRLKNPIGNNVDTVIHTVELSKNFGLIKFPDIYYLPNGFINIEIVGRDNPKIGITNINSFDINNFEIGDEFHIYDRRSYNYGHTNNKYILTIYSKEVFNDSIIYHSLKCGQSETNGVYQYWNNDTVKTKITLSNSEMINTVTGSYPFFDDYLIRLKKENRFHGRLIKTYNFPSSSYGSKTYEDGNGLGCFKFVGIYPMAGNSSSSFWDLMYYKKGSETWGIPYNCDSLTYGSVEDTMLEEAKLGIYPNPTGNIIHVKSDKSCEIIIQNTLGLIIFRKEIQGKNEENIEISNWANGLYIIRAYGNDFKAVKKFVKQ